MFVVRVDILSEVVLVAVDILTELILDVGFEMLPDIEIIVMVTPTIVLEFVVETVYAGDVLADALPVLITVVAPAIDVDMLADENLNGLAAVMTPLEFTLSSP